jgi:hypothetical protein
MINVRDANLRILENKTVADLAGDPERINDLDALSQ